MITDLTRNPNKPLFRDVLGATDTHWGSKLRMIE